MIMLKSIVNKKKYDIIYRMKELDELKTIMREIQGVYYSVCTDWEKQGLMFNQSRKLVNDIQEDVNILIDMSGYRSFLDKNENNKILNLSLNPLISHVRIKQFNSIFNKIITYSTKEVSGKIGSIPINKCFNDLFGLRIITEEKFDFSKVKEFLKQNFPTCKCLDATRANGDYRAIHIYIKKDNKNYQWELQLWFKGDEEKNHLSHKKHKQKYTQWEKLFKNKKGGYDG